MKDRSENRGVGTPAKALGILRRPLEVREILTRRLFPHRCGSLAGWLRVCYFGRIPTRAIESCIVHRARYAT
jgi:hypothetical protein